MRKTSVIILLFALCGCASLTETQINSINQFAGLTKDFSNYPKKVALELALIKRESRIFDANAQVDRTEHIHRLENIYNDLRLDKTQTEKIELSFQVLDKYAQSLLLLSSQDKIDLQKQTKDFGIDLDSLIVLYNSIDRVKKIPTGIGGAIRQLVVSGGKHYLRSQQAKDLKKFIPRGNVLVMNMTENLINYLDKKVYIKSLNDSLGLKDLIVSQKKSLEIDYGSYLSTVFARAQQPPLDSDKKYLTLLSRLDDVEALRKKTIAATRKLQAAHAEINKNILAKKTLKETIKELQLLYEDVKEIRSTVSAIQNP